MSAFNNISSNLLNVRLPEMNLRGLFKASKGIMKRAAKGADDLLRITTPVPYAFAAHAKQAYLRGDSLDAMPFALLAFVCYGVILVGLAIDPGSPHHHQIVAMNNSTNATHPAAIAPGTNFTANNTTAPSP